MKKRLLLLATFIIMFLVVGCESSKLKVSFETYGVESIEDVFISNGETVKMPTTPISEDKIFAGWYLDNELNILYNFSSPITKDLTLYAKWLNKDGLLKNISVEGDKVNFILDFSYTQVIKDVQIDLYENESLSSFLILEDGIKLDEINNLKFENLQSRKKYNLKVTITLYYNNISSDIIETITKEFYTKDLYKINYNLNGGSFPQEVITVISADMIGELPVPDKFNYKFIGWYTDDNIKIENFNEINNDLELNARWEEKQITLNMYIRSGIMAMYIDELIADYEIQNRNIKINLITYSGSYDDLQTYVYKNAINSKDTADIVIGYPYQFSQYYASGVLENLETYINGPFGYTDTELNDFIKGYLDQGRNLDSSNPNDLYSLPFIKTNEVLVYNKTAFKALFGDNYLQKIPKTWDEVETTSKLILDLVKDGKLDNISTHYSPSVYLKNNEFYPFVYDSSMNAFETILAQAGVMPYDRVDEESVLLKLNTTNVKTTIEKFKTMSNNKYFALSGNLNYNYASEAFTLLKTIMTVTSSATITYLGDDFELGYAAVPYMSEDKKLVVQDGMHIGILNINEKDSQTASWLFIKYLLEAKNNAYFANDVGYLPTRLSAYSYLENFNQGTLIKQLYLDSGYEYNIKTNFTGHNKVFLETGEMLENIISKNMDIDTAIQKAEYNLYPYTITSSIEKENTVTDIHHNFMFMNNNCELLTETLKTKDKIAWEVVSGDFIKITKVDNKVILNITKSSKWNTGIIKAITEKGVRTFEVNSIPTISVSIADIKSYQPGAIFDITGRVRYVASNGFYLEDDSAAIYVSLNSTPQENIKPGASLSIRGTKETYYGQPQVSNVSTIDIVTPAPITGYNYSMIPESEIVELNTVSYTNVEQYGRLAKITGKVIKNYKSPITGQTVSLYAIIDEESNEVAAIYNSSSQTVKDELEKNLDKTISIVVLVHDFHSSQKVWRNYGIEGTIIIK